jgi:anti-sigma factor RsiW
MTPCRKNRKLITWLALDALEPEPARALRAHLHTCDRCRSYFAEISNVTETLAAAGVSRQSSSETSATFQPKAASPLLLPRATPSPRLGCRTPPKPEWRTPASKLHAILFNWRIALPAFGAIAITTIILLLSLSLPHPSAPAQKGAAPLRTANWQPKPALAPTIFNYELVANRSLEQFDDLLTRQGIRNPPPVPRSSSLSLIDSSDSVEKQ